MKFIVLLSICLLLVGITYAQPGSGPPPGSGSGTPPEDAEFLCTNCEVEFSCVHHSDDILCAEWMFNQNGHTAPFFTDVITDIGQIDFLTDVDRDVDLYKVTTSQIPSYKILVTQEVYDGLANRPKAAEDFWTGEPLVSVGDVIEFGQSVDYAIEHAGCSLQFWPPGPTCPEDMAAEYYFPRYPTVAAGDECFTQLGTAGLFINGVSAFDWSDGASYNNAGVWENLAQEWELYDLDVCLGHAANGEYHHHNPPPCLQAELNDTGDAHSPLYGFAADGFPLYGMYQSEGVLSESCWKPRDYDDVNSLTGCGEVGVRSCLLVDQWDITKGTYAADSNGPTTSDVEMSQSSNEFITSSGLYFQDFYFDWDCAALGEQYLDQHNGHDHDDLGYHYHVTDAFPYFFGPTYYGEIDDSSFLICAETQEKKYAPGSDEYVAAQEEAAEEEETYQDVDESSASSITGYGTLSALCLSSTLTLSAVFF